jgi:hypothetical protein
VNTLYYIEECRGEQIIPPPGYNFTSRVQNSPFVGQLGQSLPLGAKLRMNLRGRFFVHFSREKSEFSLYVTSGQYDFSKLFPLKIPNFPLYFKGKRAIYKKH